MSKCHVRNFLQLYSALFKDLALYQPNLRLDLERDYSRIKSSTECMGIRVFTEYLPEIGKVLDQSISEERLVRPSIPLMGAYKNGVQIPRLFKGIWSRLFSEDGMPKHDIDPNILLFFRTILFCGKKYDMESPVSALFEQTGEFYVTDSKLPKPSLDWVGVNSDRFDPCGLQLSEAVRGTDLPDLFRGQGNLDSDMLDTIQHTADIVSGELGLIELESFRHGPGAVAERQRGIEKFQFSRWSPRLEEQFPIYGTALPLSGETPFVEADAVSRLLAVPKTIKGPRLIAAEPVDNLWCQFSIMDYLYQWTPRSLLRDCISFQDQGPSRTLALKASRSKEYATIDLKSASDRVSLWLIERIFRKNLPFLLQLRACRTEIIDLSIDKKLPSLLRLKKFTTQGAALTFPIQSIVFAIISIGVGHYREGLRPTGKSVRRIAKQVQVFGDDIIVPNTWVEDTIAALEGLFLKVNLSKTHFRGHFRESCGMDAYNGFDVTPAYVSRFGSATGPSVAAAVVDSANNFFLKGFWNAANALSMTIPKRLRSLIAVSKVSERTSTDGESIPIAVNDGYICHTSFSGDLIPETAKVRWNEDLQREEILLLTSKVKKKPLMADDSLSLRAFLVLGERRTEEPSFEGILPWRPLSRWEARPVIGAGWVPHVNKVA